MPVSAQLRAMMRQLPSVGVRSKLSSSAEDDGRVTVIEDDGHTDSVSTPVKATQSVRYSA